MLFWIAFGCLISALLWLVDAYFGLRKRVAKLEERLGVGKPDRIADLTPDD
jgi:hypothetical protein